MKVSELIDMLQQIPDQNMQVCVYSAMLNEYDMPYRRDVNGYIIDEPENEVEKDWIKDNEFVWLY